MTIRTKQIRAPLEFDTSLSNIVRQGMMTRKTQTMRGLAMVLDQFRMKQLPPDFDKFLHDQFKKFRRAKI